MNKKLIAAAIAAVMAAPVVSAADTTLYGKAHLDVRSSDDGTTDNYSVNSNQSRIGVKGSEDLGNGLKAIFGFEMGYNMDNTADSVLFGRNSFAGLSGGFGTILVGQHDTPAKVAWYAAGNDHLADSIVDFSKYGYTERRLANAIAYISPSMSGFSVAAAVVPGEQSGNASTSQTVGVNTAGTAVTINTNTSANSADNLNDAYSLGLMYSGGGLKASAGYEVATSDYLGAADDMKTLQVGASYTFGDFTIGGNYEDTSDNGGVSGVDKTVWGLVGKANFGNNYVLVNYANDDVDGAAEVDTFGLAVGHNFSSRTQVYAAYRNMDDGDDADAFALGMIHTF